MPECALPDHLKLDGGQADGTGRDLDNAAQKRWRASWFAFGPRCGAGWDWLRAPVPFTAAAVPFFPVLKHWRPTPKLLLGWNVARWFTPGDKSELFVPQFVNRLVFGWQVRGEFTVTEQKSEAPFFNVGHVSTLAAYGPSPIQRLRFGFSFVLAWPLHLSVGYRRKRKGKPDFVVFARVGCRWDSFDGYYQAPAVFGGLGWN